MDLSKFRRTEHGKVSVVDVTAQVKNCKGGYAAQAYRWLFDEERVSKCEMRCIAHATPERSDAKFTRPTTSTPIATAAEVTEIIGSCLALQNFARTAQRYVCAISWAMNHLLKRYA